MKERVRISAQSLKLVRLIFSIDLRFFDLMKNFYKPRIPVKGRTAIANLFSAFIVNLTIE